MIHVVVGAGNGEISGVLDLGRKSHNRALRARFDAQLGSARHSMYGR